MTDFLMNLTNSTGIGSGITGLAVTLFLPILCFVIGLGFGYLAGRRRRVIHQEVTPNKTELIKEYYQGRLDQGQNKPDKWAGKK
jgi:uncharacterized membrane protein YoaK (UPF0700 family)